MTCKCGNVCDIEYGGSTMGMQDIERIRCPVCGEITEEKSHARVIGWKWRFQTREEMDKAN